MNILSVVLLWLGGILIGVSLGSAMANHDIQAVIQDNGCAKPTKLELKPAVYNTWPNNKGIM